MPPMIAALAQQSAIKAVKDQLRRQGQRLVDVEYRVLIAIVREYLNGHPGVYHATMEWVLGSPDLRKLWDREQAKLAKLKSPISNQGTENARA